MECRGEVDTLFRRVAGIALTGVKRVDRCRVSLYSSMAQLSAVCHISTVGEVIFASPVTVCFLFRLRK